MPLVIEPIQELKQIEIQPSIEKVEYSQIHAVELAFLISAIFVVYLLREPILKFLGFLIKLSLITLFVYCSYILFIQ